MNMEVVGRHALLFDDDSMANFVNSRDALVEWNSLLIDRYDVRHLLHSPPPPVKRRVRTEEELQLDEDRYLDLTSQADDVDDQASQNFRNKRVESCNLVEPPYKYQTHLWSFSHGNSNYTSTPFSSGAYTDYRMDVFNATFASLTRTKNGGAEHANASGFHAVGFSYGNTEVSNDPKIFDGSGFLPPFPVPESLLQSLPPTEKLHQIMARTALFVSKNGGQSEIVLRVKQGNNPTFGFLMPDHQLHAYFRFLVDNPKFLESGSDAKPEDEDKKAGQEHNKTGVVAGGALSLLGSAYDSGEDDDGTLHSVSESKESKPEDIIKNVVNDKGLERQASSGHSTGKDSSSKHNLASAKEKAPLSKKTRTCSSTALTKKKESDAVASLPGSLSKIQTSALPSASKVEPPIVEPPSDVKRMVEKIVEFILKNGKEFEAVLREQDITNRKFLFLLPSNQYHPYYVKALEKAQEAKQVGKSFTSEKPELVQHRSGKVTSLSRSTDTLPGGSAGLDIPYDSERKEKFKMVIGGPKKDAHEPTPKPAQQQSGLSVDAAAAILQAATRGVRNPKLDIIPKTSKDDSGQGHGSDGGPNSSFGTLSFPPRIHSSSSKPVNKGETSVSTPIEFSGSVGYSGKEGNGTRDVTVDKAIAKTAALAAAGEADSSEACLTREEKQKAERLKRAKMFAAMIKSGAAPRVNGYLPRLSAEPPDSVNSGLDGSGCKAETRDGSLVRDASNISGGTVVDREREGSSVPFDVSTLDRAEKPEKDSEDDYKERISRRKQHLRSRRIEDDEEEERDHRHSRKKHRSHHSSHRSKDDHRHRKRHSSSKDKESRHRHKHDSSSEDEEQYKSRSDKRRKSHHEKKVKSDGESSRKVSDESNTGRLGNAVSREASVDLINDRWVGSAPSMDTRPSEPSQSTTEVPNDLRAKVRAMLLATL